MPDVRPTAPATVATEGRAFVEMKGAWSDDWIAQPHIFPDSLSIASGSAGGTSELRMSYRYGTAVVQPGLTSYDTYDPLGFLGLSLIGSWVRLRLLPAKLTGQQQPKPVTLWIGRVDKVIDDYAGVDASSRLTGTAVIVAGGPERFLDKIEIGTSWWRGVSGSQQRVPWHPNYNDYAPNGSSIQTQNDPISNLRGNMYASSLSAPSGEPGRPSFYFGTGDGTDTVWDHRRMLEHLLQRHVSQWTSGETQPDWFIGGQASGGPDDILATLSTVVVASDNPTAKELLGRIVPSEYGLDWKISVVLDADDPTVEKGFSVDVFSMLPTSTIWSGSGQVPGSATTLPLNPRVVDFSHSVTLPQYSVRVERSGSARYDKVRVQGQRVVAVFSASNTSSQYAGLTAGWTTAQENEYKYGAGLADPPTGDVTPNRAKNDSVRSADKFRDVFQRFVVAPLSPTDEFYRITHPSFYPTGSYIVLGSGYPGAQDRHRRTLAQLPLREGWDYTANPPTGDASAALMPLLVIVQTAAGPVAVDQLGHVLVSESAVPYQPASVAPLDDEWGFRIRSAPNHAFASSNWSGAKPTNFNMSYALDYANLTVTLAAEVDARQTLEYVPLDAIGDGSVKIIDVPEAHFHWLVDGTVLGTKLANNSASYLTYSGPAKPIRNDVMLLHRRMAGAIARFTQERQRAIVAAKKLEPWHTHLGAILKLNLGAQSLSVVQAVITGVDYDFRDRSVSLSTGQANPSLTPTINSRRER